MRIALVAVVFALVAACVDVQEPGLQDIVVNVAGGGTGGACDLDKCTPAAMKGRAFRVTALEIDEPEAFATVLNLMWKGDIQNNTLNVIIHVDDAVRNKGSLFPFDDLTITLGPSWREPKEPAALPAPSGTAEDAASVITDYCLLAGLNETVDFIPYHGNKCEVKAVHGVPLFFHSGPKDKPNICAPDNTPKNNIPISDLSMRATLNEDCTALEQGFLEGCLMMSAADRICMCLGGAQACTNLEKSGGTYDEDSLDEACKKVCGDWISFGNLIRGFSLAPACLTAPDADGKQYPGYLVRGFFTARAIDPAKYNAVKSDDCTKH